MQLLIRLLGWLGRVFNAVRQALVHLLLFFVYLFGVGLLSLGIRLRSLAGRGEPASTLQPAGPQDLSESSLKKMV